MSRAQRRLMTMFSVLFLSALGVRFAIGDEMSLSTMFSSNDRGVSETVTTASRFDMDGPFFQSLGTNERTCGTCHQPSDGWSVTPSSLRRRFLRTDGIDPIFRTNDGAICPTADVSTLDARRRAYSTLLRKGLIRVSLPMPSNAEFSVMQVDDPYNCTSSGDLAVFRRPLPTTNLKFLSAVMWDGRQTHAGKTMEENLTQQAIDATLGHAEAYVAPTADQLKQIVSFEQGLFTAQVQDWDAGMLNGDGAFGGPVAVSHQPFFIGINDPLGLNPTGEAFDARAFTLFSAWGRVQAPGDDTQEARRAIARGQELFNTRPIAITGVGGLNDVLGAPTIAGTCTTCHDAPNVGNHSVSMPLNIGVSDEANRTLDLPLYTLQCHATGEIVKTSDPGRALISGKCADIGKVKGPILRGLAARAPYFHNGSAATIEDVVKFYDRRFSLRLTARERADLVAFLGAL